MPCVWEFLFVASQGAEAASFMYREHDTLKAVIDSHIRREKLMEIQPRNQNKIVRPNSNNENFARVSFPFVDFTLMVLRVQARPARTEEGRAEGKGRRGRIHVVQWDPSHARRTTGCSSRPPADRLHL